MKNPLTSPAEGLLMKVTTVLARETEEQILDKQGLGVWSGCNAAGDSEADPGLEKALLSLTVSQ